MERDGPLELDKASRHHNRVPIETCFSEPKVCSNCNLQYGEFWVYECLWEYNNTARVCKPCVAVYMCSVCAFIVN